MKVLYILLAILMFGFMVLVHELGHYLMARVFHVTIKEFSIGMGPKIFSRVSKKNGITYSLRALPIGGFVSMVGEDETSEEEGALNNKPVWQKMLITVAGAVVNILCAVLVMSILVASSKVLGSTVVSSFFSDKEVYSQESGLMVGDKIIKVNRVKVHTSSELMYELMEQGGRSSEITKVDTDGDGENDALTVVLNSMTVERSGQTVVLEKVKLPGYTSSGHIFGSNDFYVDAEDKNIGTVLKHAVFESWNCFKVIWDSLVGLIQREYTLDDLSGPVGVTSAISTAAETGIDNLLYIFVLISMNLGVFNLLPIPALDGGRIVFLLIELLRGGKKIKPEIEGYVHFIGICLLMLLMVIITYKDVLKLL